MIQTKVHVLKITLISIFFMGLTIVLEALWPIEPFVFNVFMPLWVFSILPAYAYALIKVSRLGFHKGFILGWRSGAMLGLDFIFVPLLLAPAFMVVYYRMVIDELYRK